jgi:hypothetical protein
MIREDSSVDAPDSFEVSLPCALARHHASHVPRDVSSRRCFLLQLQAVLFWATHVDGRSAAYVLRYPHASSLLLVAVFSASALFSDSCCSGTMCGCRQFFQVWCSLHGRRSFEAARVTMQPWPPSLPAEAHTSADCPLRRIAAPLWYPLFAVSLLHVFLRSGSSVFAFVKSMIYLRGVTSHRLSRL